MRILLITSYFPPDTGSAAHLFYDLGTALVQRGHQVTVLTGMPGYHAQGKLDQYRGQRRVEEQVNGMHVVRVTTPSRSQDSLIGRALWQFGGAVAFFAACLRLPAHDVSMVYSPPLPLGLTAWSLGKLKTTPFILNVQDLFPQSIIDLGLLKNRWIIRAFEAMERFAYRHAQHITVHSPGNREHVLKKGARPELITVVPNWVDTIQIRSGERINGFRKEHGLDDAFVVSFAGVLGYSQDLDVVLDAAALLRHRSDVVWLIVGDGVEKPRLEARQRQMGLANVRFLPMQPRERYPDVLHASDVSLATLRADVKTPVVPSKILSIMAAARPVVAAMALAGDAPRLIEDAQCGICIPPGDARALADTVLELAANPSLRERLGQNGRRYAEEHLSLHACVAQYEELLLQVVGS